MKTLFARLSALVMLVVFGVIFYQTPSASGAPQYCGQGSYRCGDLEKNGTCCRTEDKCCYVSPERGSCYCVHSTDRCNRY